MKIVSLVATVHVPMEKGKKGIFFFWLLIEVLLVELGEGELTRMTDWTRLLSRGHGCDHCYQYLMLGWHWQLRLDSKSSSLELCPM